MTCLRCRREIAWQRISAYWSDELGDLCERGEEHVPDLRRVGESLEEWLAR